MRNKNLYYVWLGLYILTAALGFFSQPGEFLKAVMILASLAFFVPGFLLLRRGERANVRRISLGWLVLTLALLLINIGSATASDAYGKLVHGLLVICSAPMVCGQYWVVSLFLWACLFFASLEKKKK